MASATEAASGGEAKKVKKVSFGRARRFSYESSDRLKQLERGFVLDGVCVSHLANDETDRTFPSLNIGIPQYQARNDRHAASYFKRRGLPKLVKEEEEEKGEKLSTMQGKMLDRFHASSEAVAYLKEKEKHGAGHTRRLWGGHTTVPTDPARVGWYGEEGYRRNTPDLRSMRSVFDYKDPFDDPQPTRAHKRTQSAPATIRLMRQKSASVYRSFPGGRRAISAMPRPKSGHIVRDLATGPVT